VVKKKPATKGPDTPSERVRRYARSLAGVSAGQNDGEPYTSSLYFAEAALSQMNDGSVNLIGEPIDPQNEITKNFNINNIESWSPEFSKLAPVEKAYGQYEWARAASLAHSSCALFARACYYAGGFNAGFFTSLYPPSTAQAGLRFSFVLRNYKWLKDDGTFNVELYNIMNELFSGVKSSTGKDSFAIANNVLGGLEIDIGPDGRATTVTPSYNERLSSYIKPFNERPYIGTYELAKIAQGKHPDCPDFPALSPGDLIYVKGKANNDHVSVLEEPRPAGFEADPATKLLKVPFISIDGGQVDPDNLGSVETPDEYYEDFPYNLNYIDPDTQKKYPDGAYIKVGDKVRVLFYTEIRVITVKRNGIDVPDISNYYTVDITEVLKVGKPTAILRVNRDLGVRSSDGFSIGSRNITLTNGSTLAYNDTRKIQYIVRSNIMLDEKENSQEKSPGAGIAAAAQDDLTGFLWKRRIEFNGGDDQRVYNCFPTFGAKQLKKAQDKASKNKSPTTETK